MFPAVGSAKTKESHMRTRRTAPDENLAELPSLVESAEELVLVLRQIYIEAGLSPRDALRSAEADYYCSFDQAVACPV